MRKAIKEMTVKGKKEGKIGWGSSVFRRGINEIFALLECYTTHPLSYLQTFRDKFSGHDIYRGSAIGCPVPPSDC